MKKSVILSVRGQQAYLDQDPEVVELVTEGILEQTENGWKIQYEESDLTGLDGVITTFFVETDQITLTRTGKLNSQMMFREGVRHDSLYQMEFGALMITVCATKIDATIDENGGQIDLVYGIEIEQSTAGQISYHLELSYKE